MDSEFQSDDEVLDANEAPTEMSVCNINDSMSLHSKN